MESQNLPNNILYKQIISNDLSEELLNYFNQHIYNIHSMSGSNVFPQRKHMRDIPKDLCDKLVNEIKITMTNNCNNFNVDINNIRMYYSDFGIVKPHKDVTIKENYNNTLLIYLSDDFDGGNITVKIPIEEIKKHYYITPEPRKCYGILFPKEYTHYTDELYTGGKYIILLDCQTDF